MKTMGRPAMVSAQIFLAQVVFVSTLGSKEGGAEATRHRGTNLARFGAVALLADMAAASGQSA